MRTAIISLLLFVLSQSAYGQCDDCYFIRGDANCDGSVDLADYVYINAWLYFGGPPPANLDAADTDDNGSINGTDATVITQMLYQGGSGPACPFPDMGRDCTPDEINTCCSPGEGDLELDLSTDFKDEDIECPSTIWDDWGSQSASWDDGKLVLSWSNSSSCGTDDTCNYGVGAWTVDDEGLVFTKRMLEESVASLTVGLTGSYSLEATTACVTCPTGMGINGLAVEWGRVAVEVVPVGAGSPFYVYAETASEESLDYCPTDSKTGAIDESADITLDILTLLDSEDDCAEWRIGSVAVAARGTFVTTGAGQDNAENEAVEIELLPDVVIGLCDNGDCGQ